MDTNNFLKKFSELTEFTDYCPQVQGHTSPKVQTLLNLAHTLLPEDEAYLEIGALHGKTFISACSGHSSTAANVILDNFSQFGATKSVLCANICACLPDLDYMLHSGDYRELLTSLRLPAVGVYFYDGPHELSDQRDAIRLIEKHLASESLIIIDDWNHAPVKPGTLAGAAEFPGKFELVLELPAKFNGDCSLFWNGLGVLAYHRK